MKSFFRTHMPLIGFLTLCLIVTTPHTEEMMNHDISDGPKVHIIFDLGGICVETSMLNAARYMGPVAMAKYAVLYQSNPRKIKNVLYRILNKIESVDTYSNAQPCDPDGDQLPSIMCDWMTNRKTNEEIRTLVIPAIKANLAWFNGNATEQLLVYKLAKMMFTPKSFIDTRYLIAAAQELAIKCKKKGYRISILSNWDSESFEMLKEKYATFFNLFDEICISGKSGKLKPNLSAYEELKQKYPTDTFGFIDDQIENINAAEKCNITGILCKSIQDINQAYSKIDAIAYNHYQKVNSQPSIRGLPSTVLT